MLNVAYETGVFRSMFMLHGKTNYPEKTELDTNPSLTLARNPTLSTGERSFGYFTSSRFYDTAIFNLAHMNSPYNLGRDPESRSEIDLRRKMKLTPRE